jgi:hypothetical protein
MSTMNRTLVLLFAPVAVFAACATAPVPEGEPPAPRESIDEAAEALARSRYATASFELNRVFEACESTELGYLALLLTASANLDPRNPEAELDRAALQSAWILADERAPIWMHPLAEILYLQARHLGAEAPDPERFPTRTAGSPEVADDNGPDRPHPSVEAEEEGGEEAKVAAVTKEAAPSRLRRLFGRERPLESESEASEEHPCGPEVVSPAGESRALPDHPALSIPTRIALLERELERFMTRNEELSVGIARLEEELERIRRSLIPR